jgi:hypothetical protein
MVYFKTIKEIFLSPVSAIKKAKKEKNLNKSLTILFVDWVLFALSALILSRNLASSIPTISPLFFGLFVFFLGYLASLLLGLIIQIIFTILGGKGGYFESITPLSYCELPLSLGVFLAGLFSLVALAGLLISLIILSILVAMSIAIFYRGIKEMFKVDLITAWIGIGLIFATLFFAFYLSMIFSVPNLFMSLRMGKPF